MTPSQYFRLSGEAVKYNICGWFPFVSKYLKKKPIWIRARLTYRCSGKCKSCDLWTRDTASELSAIEWKSILNKLKTNGVWSISFSGGDIFLRHDIFEILEYSNQLGFRTSCMVNGYSISENRAQRLMALGIHSVCLSLDDLTAKFDNLRGVKNAADKVQKSIKYLKKHSNGVTTVRLSATLMRDTIESIPNVVAFAIKNNLPVGFNLIHFNHFFTDTPFSRDQYKGTQTHIKALKALILWLKREQKKHPHILSKPAFLEWILKYFKDYHETRTPCYQPMAKLCLEPNGDVHACCSMDIIGNVKTQDLNNILKREKYHLQVMKGLTKTCPGCSCSYTRNLDLNFGTRIRSLL